jgi:hypothetical protein
MDKKRIEQLIKDASEFVGTEKGERARKEYEIYKMETERKRNVLLFYNTIFLAIIALVNLIYAILRYYTE